FAKGTFAPTKTVWSVDNRTAGFRLCGAGTKGVRVECRIGGADLNPYLALAVQLAAGIQGITEQLPLPDPTVGDAYNHKDVIEIPASLQAATDKLQHSQFLRTALGDDVVDHYTRAAQWEQEEYDRIVTDYEVARGFERA
ncbi:MAG: glutamine synthetase, partial [Gammaproteobacteria bacterium]|nr:glutamine synthetase [Gammaproteobacteria bacterium]